MSEQRSSEVKLTEDLVDCIKSAMSAEWETAYTIWTRTDEMGHSEDKRPLRLTRVKKALAQMAREGTYGVDAAPNDLKKSAKDGRDPVVYRLVG